MKNTCGERNCAILSKSVQDQPFLDRVLAKKFRHYLPKINQHTHLVENKVFCSVLIHVVFIVFTLLTYFGYGFQYIKENLCDDFCSGVSLFLSLPFWTFTMARLGFHLYNIVHIQMMLLCQQELTISVQLWKYLSPIRMEKVWANNFSLQHKAEVTSIYRNRGEVKLPWTQGKVCFTYKLFCNIISDFAIASCRCIKNIV